MYVVCQEPSSLLNYRNSLTENREFAKSSYPIAGRNDQHGYMFHPPDGIRLRIWRGKPDNFNNSRPRSEDAIYC